MEVPEGGGGGNDLKTKKLYRNVNFDFYFILYVCVFF